jgi:hypothetical protein
MERGMLVYSVEGRLIGNVGTVHRKHGCFDVVTATGRIALSDAAVLEQIENIVTLECKGDALVVYICPVHSGVINSA